MGICQPQLQKRCVLISARDGNNGKGLLLPKPAKSNAPSPLSHQATDADQPYALTEALLMGEQAEPRDLFAKLNRLADSF